LNFGAILEAGAIGALTAGLTNGITYNSSTGELGLGNLNQGLDSLPQDTSTLGQLAGLSSIGNSLSGVAQAGATAADSLPQELAAMGATATISAGVQTAIGGGSFLSNLESAGLNDVAAIGAYEIGNVGNDPNSILAEGSVGYDLAHAALGCAISAAGGTGCAGGAIGGAASAAFSPDLINAMDPSGAPLTTGQQAALGAFATLLGGGLAGLAGQNAIGGATAGQNEALNNSGQHLGQGGLIDSIVSWAQNTYGDPVGSVQNWISQFTGQMQSGAQGTISQSPSALVAQGVANGVNAVTGTNGGLPPTAGSNAALVGSGAGQVTLPVSGGAPPNAILSSSNDGSNAANTAAGDVDSSTPTGQGGSPMDVTRGTNSPATVGGISYSGHALDEMQSDGIVPSVVKDVIENGTKVPGKIPGTVVYYNSTNNITVVTNPTSGNVITVSFGKIRQ
jgi:filamentous hemagglutinin